MWRCASTACLFTVALVIYAATSLTQAQEPAGESPAPDQVEEQLPLIQPEAPPEAPDAPEAPGVPEQPALPADPQQPPIQLDPEEELPEAPDVEVPDEVEVTDVTEGEGAEAESGDFAIVHLVGRVREGHEFRNTRDEGQPLTIRIGHHELEGLNEGLVGMREGGTRELAIPPAKGFGERGQPRLGIPPEAVLEYEVEMLELHPGIRRERKQDGVGDPAKPGDLVKVRFEANFTGSGDRTVTFTSGDEPLEVALGYGRALLGIEEGLEGVKAGERVVLKLDPRLAFGVSGLAGVVPDNAHAEYDIEVIDVTPGIDWEVEEEGDGAPIADGDPVRAQVTVTLADDGEKVASTFDGDGPVQLQFGEGRPPFPSLFLAMRDMKPGEVRRATIAAPFAFGSRGFGDIIPPDADLVYRIELLAD